MHWINDQQNHVVAVNRILTVEHHLFRRLRWRPSKLLLSVVDRFAGGGGQCQRHSSDYRYKCGDQFHRWRRRRLMRRHHRPSVRHGQSSIADNAKAGARTAATVHRRDGLCAPNHGTGGIFCMAAPLVGVSPLFAVFFGGTTLGKWLLQNEPGQQLNSKQNFTAGAIAGVFTTAVMVPGERIKCILQVQSMDASAGTTPKYNGPVDVVRKLYREGGIRSIYRGTAATLLRDIPASGAYIAVYELLKDKFSGGERNELTPMATLLAGGFAGIANWSVCIPADEGHRALFRGFVPVMLCAFHANAACFSGLELALWAFRQAGI
ncbi:hypothetical protein niasHS_013949 [Heterodera schachtii]|uniref:Mitochondrial carnitine/acylcarnitine carrier protein n=1 Tax=Heterodera schachtii TaxID=97005 RepID=A0ABD2INM8_HETSC